MACGADSECRFSVDLEQASMGSDDSSVLNNTTLLLPAIGQLGACIYMIFKLERTIQRNRLSMGISEWKFGQILAMMMLLGPAIESMSLLPLARFGRVLDLYEGDFRILEARSRKLKLKIDDRLIQDGGRKLPQRERGLSDRRKLCLRGKVREQNSLRISVSCSPSTLYRSNIGGVCQFQFTSPSIREQRFGGSS